jgi:hypothetical protein
VRTNDGGGVTNFRVRGGTSRVGGRREGNGDGETGDGLLRVSLVCAEEEKGGRASMARFWPE